MGPFSGNELPSCLCMHIRMPSCCLGPSLGVDNSLLLVGREHLLRCGSLAIGLPAQSHVGVALTGSVLCVLAQDQLSESASPVSSPPQPPPPSQPQPQQPTESYRSALEQKLEELEDKGLVRILRGPEGDVAIEIVPVVIETPIIPVVTIEASASTSTGICHLLMGSTGGGREERSPVCLWMEPGTPPNLGQSHLWSEAMVHLDLPSSSHQGLGVFLLLHPVWSWEPLFSGRLDF